MNQVDFPEFYKPFDSKDFHYEKCFLCGEQLNDKQPSLEHVFPKWLLNEFSLWNNTLILSNGSEIQYRFLTIPCCQECNNGPLATMEKDFIKLKNLKFQDLEANDEKVIFQWTAKLLYGMMYKNLSLLYDRKNPSDGNIFSPQMLENYSTLHLFLQSIRIPTQFSYPYPWSIFIFQFGDSNFNFISNYNCLSISIKLGEIGIIITFEDNKEVESKFELLKALYAYRLNNVQFLEVTAKIVYQRCLLSNTPKYLTAYNSTNNVININSMNSVYFDTWSNQYYGEVFENYLKMEGIHLKVPIFNGVEIATTLVDNDGIPLIDKVKGSL